MANTELSVAKLDLLRAQTQESNAIAALTLHELNHKEVGDRGRIYHFPAPIFAETIDPCIEVLQHWMDLDPYEPMTVAFNSPGGSVFEGFALFDFIADHVEQGIPIDTTAYGKCMSMATVVLQSGRQRSLHRNAFFMVHEVQSFIQGTLQNLKDQMEFTAGLQDRTEKVLLSRTNVGALTQEELHTQTLHKDWWMTPEEALDIGFIDYIAQ